MNTDSAARTVVLRQRYTLWQRIRANMYGRLPLVLESLIALALITAILVVDVVFFLHHGYSTLGDALVATLGLLALQVPNVGHGDQTALTLLAFNLLFSLLFAQSVLNSLRALFTKRSFALQQQGLAATLRDHIIICGLGRLQIRAVVRLVEEGYPVAVIQQGDDSPLLQRALAMEVPVIYGNATAPDILRLAGLQRARAVLALIDGDLIDVEIALAVRAIRPDIRVILRAFSEDFDRGLEKVFGPNTAFSASALAAPTFAIAAITRHVEQAVRLGDDLLAVMPLAVPHAWNQCAALEAAYGIRILSRLPGKATDRIFALAPLAALDRLRAAGELPPGAIEAEYLKPTATHDRVIICGLGKIGYRVVKLIHQMEPHPHIVVVHLDDGEASFAEQIAELTSSPA
jgi:voltage-gated potassium channel Kch